MAQLRKSIHVAMTWFRRRRLRTQLLVVTNLLIGTSLLALLYVDYLHTMHVARQTKVASLSDEAQAIAIAVASLTDEPGAAQAHIDSICTAMDRVNSPGHTIEVRADGTVLRSHASLHGEPDRPDADPVDRISGSGQSNGTSVTVSEHSAGAVRQAGKDAALRASVVALAGIAGAGLVNLLLLRLVNAPLRQLTHFVRGVAHGDFDQALRVGGSAEIEYLGTEIRAMSQALARREDDRRSQLARARRLQQHLLRIPGPAVDRATAIEFHPADEVAGDFADIIHRPDGTVVLCLADIVGHGIAAAMGAAIIKAIVLSLDIDAHTPAELLNQINARFIEASLPEDFASMILVKVDLSLAQVVYASAGHETCYVCRRDGRLSRLESTGMLLGVCASANYVDATVALQPRDKILLLSDGVTEAMDERGTRLGRDRIAKVLTAATTESPAELASLIRDAVGRHCGGARRTDDMTVMVFAADRAGGVEVSADVVDNPDREAEKGSPRGRPDSNP